MTVCYVRLMPGFLMIPCFMVVGSGSMMFCGVLKLEHRGLQGARRDLYRKSSTVWTRLLQARDYSRVLSS
jgi:hypothetical protein